MLIKPEALKLGDTIGLITPATSTSNENVKKSKNKLIEMGFKVKVGESPYKLYGYLSGSDEIRRNDINKMFSDDEVDGIICIRGGYGAPRILDLIDYNIIKKNPKVFVGYSDITALHIAFNQKANLVTYHGPMVASNMIGDFNKFSKENLLKAIMNTEPMGKISNPEGEDMIRINGGIAEGHILGGNLSLIVDTIGTPYEIDLRGKILFIEEVGEDLDNIDRMINQLRLSGKLHEAEGIILGDFKNCDSSEYEDSLSLRQIFNDHIKATEKPTIFNLKAGHCDPTLTLPFGVKARLDADKKELVILESATK